MAARIPNKLGLRAQDWGDEGINSRDAVERLVNPLNTLSSDLTSLLSKKLRFGDNFECDVKTFRITTPTTDWVSLPADGTYTANAGGTSDQGPPAVRKDANGRVEGRGTFGGGALGDHVTTFPAGYRPEYTACFPVNAGNAAGAVTVSAAGDLRQYAGSTAWFSLAGISFVASDRSPGVLGCFPLDMATSVQSPKAFVILSCRDVSTSASGGVNDPVLALGSPDWSIPKDGYVRLKNLPGLRLGRTYELTALILPKQG